MIQSQRSELLSLLTRIGELAPDFRLGQLIASLTDRADTLYTADPIANVEDQELILSAKEFLLTLEMRREGDPLSFDPARCRSMQVKAS